MEIKLITAAGREKSYLGETLESLLPLYPRIYAGSPSQQNAYLNPYRPIYPVKEQDNITYPDARVGINFNYFRVFFTTKDKPEFVTCEDDVVFSKDWLFNLYELTQNLNGSFIVGLYWPTKLSDGKLLAKMPVVRFCYSQAIYYKNFPSVDFSYYLWHNGVEHYRDPIDLLLARYCYINDIKIFVCQPSLVQHVGIIRHAGLSSTFHQSETFSVNLDE